MKQKQVDVDFDILKGENELLAKTRKSLKGKVKEETYIAFKNYDLLLGVLIMSLGTKKALNQISNICNQMRKKITKIEASSLAKRTEQNKNAIHFNQEGIKVAIQGKTIDELQGILKVCDKTRKVHIVYTTNEESKCLLQELESHERIYIYKYDDFYLLGVYELDGKNVQTDIEEMKPQKQKEQEEQMEIKKQQPKKEIEQPQQAPQQESYWFEMVMISLIILIILLDMQFIDLSFLKHYHEFYVLKTATKVIEFINH